MNELIFREGLPVGFKPDFDLGLFHSPLHVLLQSQNDWHSFCCLNESKKQVMGMVHFHISEGTAKSPLKSPYSSFIFSSQLSADDLLLYVQATIEWLKKKSVRLIVVKNPPEVYSSIQLKLLENILLSEGFELQSEELSAVIPITQNAFEFNLHRSEQKRLRKSVREGLIFRIAPLENLSIVYTLLEGWRMEKGYELSMSLQELEKTVAAFPDNFLITEVSLNQVCVAANISVRVNSEVLYNFYHDHSKAFNHLSPVVLLNEGLYKFCQSKSLRYLDLGASMAKGVAKSSLLDFKVRLGAELTRKCTFKKYL